jgi:prolyl-tRNA synthetase
MMGGTGAHEFMAVTEAGEDTLIICGSCDYKANREIARAKRKYASDSALVLEKVETPGQKTIEDVAQFLKVKPEQTVKAVLYAMDGKVVMCLVRGDLEVNEIKIKNHLKIQNLVMASDVELAAAGIVPGYASAIGITGVRIIVDESVAKSTNLVAGANQVDQHFKNSNFGRDYTSKEVVDFASVKEGEPCPECGSPLKVVRGIEVGNIFKLGTKYSGAMKATFLDENGKAKDMIMGCYGIGVGRLLASVLEVGAQENKIIWPISIAPFEVELLGLYSESEENIKTLCREIYDSLKANQIEVLFDDRPSSPGFKFKDADLIGSPIRIAVGSKSLAKGGVELTIGEAPAVIVSAETILAEVLKAKKELLTH